MESSEDKQWASKYLLDPLTAPEPSQETGPGSSFTNAPATPSSPQRKAVPSASTRSSTVFEPSGKSAPSVSVRSSNNPFRNTSTGHPTPPPSASPRTERFPNLHGGPTPNRMSMQTASTEIPTSTNGAPTIRNSVQTASTRIPTSTNGAASTVGDNQTARRRTSSLNQRYEGDQTHRPLEMLKKDAKSAHRAPHLRKKHHIGADSIDSLDIAGGAYHHEGPYDATLLARNTSFQNSPLEALSSSNEEALRATPREKIIDSIEKHYPLDGVAVVPPGMADRYGRTYHYQEGSDMMIDNNPEGGAYKRWPGVNYHPSDHKGKGEPSYTLEKALKANKQPSQRHNNHRRNFSDSSQPPGTGANTYEMVDRPSTSGPTASADNVTQGQYGQRRRMSADSTTSSMRPVSDGQRYGEWEGERSPGMGGKLRKRLGSMKLKGRGRGG